MNKWPSYGMIIFVENQTPLHRNGMAAISKMQQLRLKLRLQSCVVIVRYLRVPNSERKIVVLPLGPFINNVTHLGGGRGLAILLKMLGGGGVAILLIFTKVFIVS